MSDLALLLLLYGAGLLLFVAEIFVPSHGVLSVVGLGLLVAAIVETFRYGGRDAGVVAVLACLVFVPTFAFFSIKYWHRTPMGKRISPPNPVLTAADTSVPVEEIVSLIGHAGRSVTALRPVGICEFHGRRVSCIAQFGLVNAGVDVEGVGMSGANLAVTERKTA